MATGKLTKVRFFLLASLNKKRVVKLTHNSYAQKFSVKLCKNHPAVDRHHPLIFRVDDERVDFDFLYFRMLHCQVA